MKIGVSLPAREINDAVTLRDYVQALEGAGFSFVITGDHVLGGHPDRLKLGERGHTYDLPYHEPFVLFGVVAGVTRSLEMVTEILILPQRQTALVAKQAAELDLLSGGRLRLGVGLGRNWMEYEALNENFHNRGRRIEEQIEVLRRLWTEELVTYEGRYHHLDRIGLNPMPVQRPIPIWMGTFPQVAEKAIERVGRIADGWFPQHPPDESFSALLKRVRDYAKTAGRDPASLGIEGGVRGEEPEQLIEQAQAWQELGASHLRILSPVSGDSLQERLARLVTVREALQKAGF